MWDSLKRRKASSRPSSSFFESWSWESMKS